MASHSHCNSSDFNCNHSKAKLKTSAISPLIASSVTLPPLLSSITTPVKAPVRHPFAVLPPKLAKVTQAAAIAKRPSTGCKLTLRQLPETKLHAALHAAAFTLLVLLLSGWIALASAAVASDNRDLRSSSDNTPSIFVYESLVLETTNAVAQETLVSSFPDYFNSSAFLSSIISPPGASVATNGSTIANNNNNSNNNININNSISSAYGVGGLGGASAALITTSSVWDPFAGALPTNISTSPPQEKTAESGEEFVLPPLHAIVVSIILLFIILGTVVGNVLVCIAVCMVRKLRRPCNYLLVSLALSDLCVAVLVMPMALLYEVLEKWNFGPLLCDIWVSFDVLCCTASILNLCAISVDRYLAITKPLEYGVKRTPRRMMLCVALVWLAAACISLPPLLILGNEHEDEHGMPTCTVCQNFAYQIYATLGSFYIPLAVMLFVYFQIFRAARRIVLEEKRAQTHLQHALNGTGSPPGNTDLTGSSGNGQRHSSYGNMSLTYSTCGGLSAHHAGGSGGGVSGSSGLLGSPHQKKLRFQLAKEKKASTTLGIIMSAFTICWLPFFILALIRPFVESETTRVPQSLSSLFLWLGYANSLLNPIIYATLNRDFRKPFQEILYFRCSSLNTMMRENYYQDQYGEPPSQRVMLGDERHGARESFL